jgi:hypothetical protein
MTFSRCRIGRATRLASLSIGRMRIVVGRAFGRHSAAKPSELRSGLEAPKDFLDWTARRRQLTNPDDSRRPSPSTRLTPSGSAVLHPPRRQWAGARLCLLRRCGQAAHPRRGTAGLRRTSPVFRHWSIASLPHSAPHICRGLRKSGMAQCGLATIKCVAMAHASDSNRNKAFWFTLAQSWMRLAEHVARAEPASAAGYNTCVDDVQSLGTGLIRPRA